MRTKVTTIAILLIAFGFAAFRSAKSYSKKTNQQAISIEWVDDLPGDFSFRHQWDYPESVFKNRFGQISCDGNCPDAIDAMKDDDGRIYKDSLKTFYRIVDTTHQIHSINCDAWCYEWAGTDYIDVIQAGDSIHCSTGCNMATHCSLHLDFVKDSCYPLIVLNSIVAGGDAIYHCTDGYLKIDKKLWAKGIMKAEFSFNFEHKENSGKPMYWKGKIHAKINKR
jgi:hypothetical protein